MVLTDGTSANSARRSVPQEHMGTDVQWAFGLLCFKNTWCWEKYAAQLQMVCMPLKEGLKSQDNRQKAIKSTLLSETDKIVLILKI